MSQEDMHCIDLLDAKWKAGLETLHQSHLKDRGNPIYVLPWYVMLGRQGSGKSSSLRNCKVPMPLTGLPSQAEITATENLDWWFLESAVILDTAGRYAFAAKDENDRQEWETFVRLLCSTRRDEPLNGIIVVVSVEDLKTRDLETLREDAKKIRRRVDSLMKTSGMDFPVYLMVTKCDRVGGFGEYFGSLSEKGQEQILGSSNNEIENRTDPLGFLHQGFDDIVERLRRLRLSILLEMKETDGSGGAFLFPEDLNHLREPLTAFVESLFAENPYQNTPIFRSFFFVSAIQEGKPFSDFLKRLDFDEQIEVQQPTAKSFFLYDFYARVLKQDRGLSRLTRQTKEGLRNKTLAALIGWAALVLLFCVLLTFSFGRNISILNMAASDLEVSAPIIGKTGQTVAWLGKQMGAVQEIYLQNRNSIMPRLGLNHSLKVEEEMRRTYIVDFRNHLLLPLDKAISENVDAFINGNAHDNQEPQLDTQKGVPEAPVNKELQPTSSSGITVPRVADFRGKRDLLGQAATKPAPPPTGGPAPTPSAQTRVDPIQIAKYMGLILDRIAILSHCLNNPDSKELSDFNPQPDYKFMLACILPKVDNEKALLLGEEYRAYLAWQLGDALLKSELKTQTDLLNRILSSQSLGLNWIIDWVNHEEIFPPITYRPYWENSLDHIEGGNQKVDAAFTRKGWETGIEPMLDRMAKLAKDPEKLQRIRKGFERDYWKQYENQWKRFLMGFDIGEKLWKRLDNRIEIAPKILSSQSPYAKVVEDAVYELSPLFEHLSSDKETAPWLKLFQSYGKIQSSQYQEAYIAWLKEKKPSGKVPGFFSRALSKAKGVAKSASGAMALGENELEIINLFVDFDESLHNISVTIVDPQKSVEAVRQAFEEERQTNASVSPVLKAQWHLDRLKKIMGMGLPDEEPFWNLFDWPLRFGWQTELDIAGRSIQAQWERDVLANVTDLKGWQKLAALLYSEKGEVWAFISGPLAPYLEKGTDGAYRPKELLNASIAFSPEFLKMLEGGRRSQQQLTASQSGAISVRLDAKPTDVNPEAEMKVHRMAVKLICGSEVQVLENFNYPVFKTFVWKPDNCGELICEFDAGDASVEKRYTGYLAFAEFLRDIASGEKRYTASELIKTKGDIQKYGVRTITVEIELHGHEPVLKFLEHVPEDIPKTIIMKSAL